MGKFVQAEIEGVDRFLNLHHTSGQAQIQIAAKRTISGVSEVCVASGRDISLVGSAPDAAWVARTLP